MAVQVGEVRDSAGQEESWVLAQSPQLLITTVPLGSTLVAHHGVGELEHKYLIFNIKYYK